MSYNPELVLNRIRQNQQQPSQLDSRTIDELYNKINSLEQHVLKLETNLIKANEEIDELTIQKEQMENLMIKNEEEKKQIKDHLQNSRRTETIVQEPIETILQRKERSFNRFATPNSQQNRTRAHLKLEQLNSIFYEYPNLTRPILHIKLTDTDFQ